MIILFLCVGLLSVCCNWHTFCTGNAIESKISYYLNCSSHCRIIFSIYFHFQASNSEMDQSRGVKLKARGPIPARHIILCGPREHMIVLQKKKNLCYFISYIMKVRINTTRFCFYLAFYLYAETDFGVHMIRNDSSIDDDCVDGSKE